MIKITKQDVERAIDWLEIENFCCHALASALSGHHYESPMTTEEQCTAARNFLYPLLKRDGICKYGGWTHTDVSLLHVPFHLSRAEWLQKIANEMEQ